MNTSDPNFLKALYTNNDVYINVEGVVSSFCPVLSGVLQGCPSSGSLFVIAVNPFLVMLDRIKESQEQI